MGRVILTAGKTTSSADNHRLHKVERVSCGLLTFILLFPVCGCNVTSRFQLLLSGPPHHDELCLELWTQKKKPSPFKLILSEYFIVTTWRHLKTDVEMDGRRYKNWWEQANCSLISTRWWGRQKALGPRLDLNYTYAWDSITLIRHAWPLCEIQALSHKTVKPLEDLHRTEVRALWKE